MDFSQSFRCSGPHPAFSPNGRHVATAVGHRLIIRDSETLRVLQLYACLDSIDAIEWSPGSNYVMCGVFSRGLIQIWSVDSSEWSCKIDEGPAGVRAVRWSPDGTCVLAVAEWGLRVTVWSLTDRKCTYLGGPKHVGRGMAFSADGGHMAVLERSEMKDWVSVYDTRSWAAVGRYHVPGTADASDVAWSPAGGVLAVWDSCLAYKVVLLDARNGSVLGSFTTGNTTCLGIKTCSWSPGGELLAVGGHDRHVVLLNAVTWQPLMEGQHGERVGAPASVVVYREELDEAAPPDADSPAPGPSARTKYGIAQLPAPVPTLRPQLDKPLPRLGVGRCCWSGDGRYLATQEDSSPGAVWVWDLGAMDLAAVLIHTNAVTDVAWGPRGSTLVMATGCNKIHLWTPAGASVVHIPLSFQAFGCSWNSTATTLLLRGAEAFCCAYLTA